MKTARSYGYLRIFSFFGKISSQSLNQSRPGFGQFMSIDGDNICQDWLSAIGYRQIRNP
jgi:hypothetical protein